MYPNKLKGNLLLLLTAFVWGLSFIAQSKGVESLSPLAFNGIRSCLGGVVLLPVILLLDRGKKKRGEKPPSSSKALWKAGLICGVLLCIATTLQTVGMVETSPGKAGFITALYMVIVPFLQWARGKKPGALLFLSVLLAVAGLYLMCIQGVFRPVRGDLLILCCAVVFAFHILAIDQFSPKVDGVKLACLQFFVCGVLDLLLMLFFERVTLGAVLQNWLPIGYSGIFSCGVAYTLQIVGQKYTDPTSASILMSLESVFATLSTVVLIALGVPLTGGEMTVWQIVGCVLMFGATLLVQIPPREKKKIKNT